MNMTTGLSDKNFPTIIQGGMGAGVSGWTLARSVSKAGQLGVVAGTALDVILARRLQLGDPGGHMRRALEVLPLAGVAERLVKRYFIRGGKPQHAPFTPLPALDVEMPIERSELIVAANFAEVHLAKEGHGGVVGINYLEKIQLPTLPSLYGAMLAEVDSVLMGAGIPRAIPRVLEDLAAGRAVQIPVHVHGASADHEHLLHFDPNELFESTAPVLPRPKFMAIVASVTVATLMARKAEGVVDGLILEGPLAGGHNAPPRGKLRLNSDGEPIFGDRDVPDLQAIRKLDVPFWMAGSFSSPKRVQAAKAQGAVGVQVGTAFAFCEQSGIAPSLKRRAIEQIRTGTQHVRTDPLASPTGFPFKVFELTETLSEGEVFEQRKKVCDLGYLRQAFLQPAGSVGWRCPAEPDVSYLHKGGDTEEIAGRKCVCNGLLANIGLGQVYRNGRYERPLLTSGSDMEVVATLLNRHGDSYSAEDVLDLLLDQRVARN